MPLYSPTTAVLALAQTPAEPLLMKMSDHFGSVLNIGCRPYLAIELNGLSHS